MTKYKITVSEPFDFIGPIGGNLIVGEIIKVLSPLLIIFKSDHLLSFEGKLGRILILKPRYEKQVLNQENNYEGTVGGGLLLIEDYEGKDEKYLEANSKYVLIGQLAEN
jgi:hypothetical protein